MSELPSVLQASDELVTVWTLFLVIVDFCSYLITVLTVDSLMVECQLQLNYRFFSFFFVVVGSSCCLNFLLVNEHIFFHYLIYGEIIDKSLKHRF